MACETKLSERLRRDHDELNCLATPTGFKSDADKRAEIERAMKGCWDAAAALDTLEAALKDCQKTLAILIDPANAGSGINNMVVWASCVASESNARAALRKAEGRKP